MSASAWPRMTADEFLAWTADQPEAGRHELVDGVVWSMAPERLGHVRAKQRLFLRLNEATARAGAACEVLMDGAVIAVDDTTLYQPDVSVRCGPALGDDIVRITDPIIVAEVLSPGTRSVDTGVKFTDYFRIASLRHYLIMRAETGAIIHHARDDSGVITTRILHDGSVRLDPPGLEVQGLFAAEPPR